MPERSKKVTRYFGLVHNDPKIQRSRDPEVPGVQGSYVHLDSDHGRENHGPIGWLAIGPRLHVLRHFRADVRSKLESAG